MLHDGCPDGRRLLDRYIMALAADDAISKARRAGYASGTEAKDLQDSLVAARNAYWRHVEHHKCRSLTKFLQG
jgi:hypothetical protein